MTRFRRAELYAIAEARPPILLQSSVPMSRNEVSPSRDAAGRVLTLTRRGASEVAMVRRHAAGILKPRSQVSGHLDYRLRVTYPFGHTVRLTSVPIGARESRIRSSTFLRGRNPYYDRLGAHPSIGGGRGLGVWPQRVARERGRGVQRLDGLVTHAPVGQRFVEIFLPEAVWVTVH